MTHTIAFDLDGTLVDSVPQIASCINIVLSARGQLSLDVKTVQGFADVVTLTVFGCQGGDLKVAGADADTIHPL